MALSRILPFAFDDDLWRSLADLERRQAQSQQLSLVDPMSVGMREAFRMDNPIITDKDGNKKFHLDFDLRQFKPEEIELTTKDNTLCVHAKHEEKSEGRTSYREYRRQYALPPGVATESLSSKLRHDGVLSIEAPVQQRQDVRIPIAHKK